jgi:hypothetical protein
VTRLVLLFAVTGGVHARDFRFGIKGGVPITRYFETGSTRGLRGDHEYSAATRRYTVGVTAQWTPRSFAALQIDALYRRTGYVSIASSLSGSDYVTAAFDVKGNSFDFPLTAFLRLPRLPVFAGAGGVLRYIYPTSVRGERVARDITGLVSGAAPRVQQITDAPELQRRLYAGLTVSLRVDLPTGRTTIQPEFRYTRWSWNLANPMLHFAPNQAEMLVAVVF